MFLSLTVHEALTFETEICLHPDLFQNASDAATIASGRHSLLVPPPPSSVAGATSTTSGNTTPIIEGPSHVKPLKAGDFIEIRVWDGANSSGGGSHYYSGGGGTTSLHLPPHGSVNAASGGVPYGGVAYPVNTNSSVSSSVLLPSRRQRAPSPPLEKTPSVEVPPTASTAPNATTGGTSTTAVDGESVASSTERQQNLTPLNLTPQPSPRPSESEKLAAALPPPFPRSRAGTADAAAVRASMNRRSIRNSPKISQPKHVRDISDISADLSVLVGAAGTTASATTTTALDATHQLVDLQVPFSPHNDNNINNNNNYNNNVDHDDADDDTMGEDGTATTATSHLNTTHVLRLKFYMLLNEASLTSLKPSARTQVSLLRQVADLYQLSSYDMVTVHRVVDQEAVRQEMAADFCLITIKDQYISRGDLHFFQQSLVGSFLYEGQRLQDTARGISAHAREIRRGEIVAPTCVVTENTKIAYRSRSSRIFWLIQMSAEMWDYSAPFASEDGCCEVYFDKFLAFCYELFTKWKSVDVTHSLTVVFFSRTFVHAGHRSVNEQGSTVQKDVYGRFYEDHIRLVLENETRADWDSLVLKIRQAFWKYPQEVGWNLYTDERARWPSSAAQGNVLETINVTLNLLQYHYMDRDLHRTGNSIVLVSAGNGVFEVSKELSQITYQRMMDNGIGSDMLSLGLPPLHTAPFFMYVKQHQAVSADGVDTAEQYFEVPHWMHLSFVSYESDTQLPVETKSSAQQDGGASSPMPQNNIKIGPDGFILRHPTEDLPGSMASSPAGIRPYGAHSPTRQQRLEMRQDRQLIAGRDFGDILRATRPRYSASLPRPFRTLLQSQGKCDQAHHAREESGAPNQTTGKHNIKEWNSMESDDASDGSIHIRSRGVSLGQDPRDAASPVLVAKSPPRIDVLELMGSSPSRSYTTQLSGGLLGSSLEKQHEFLYRSPHSPKLVGMQLQRTRSLEWGTEANDALDAAEGDIGSGTSHSYAVSGADHDAMTSQADITKMMDSIKALMRSTDANSLKVASPKLVPQPSNVELSRHSSTDASLGRSLLTTNLSKSPKFGPRNILSRPGPPQNQGSMGGGIGAALSQYRGSTNSLSSDTDGSANMSRVSSYGRLSSSALLRIPEVMKGGMSPLLLPPTQPSHDPAPEAMRPDSRTSGLEHRLIDTNRVGSMDGSYLRPSRGRLTDGMSGRDRRLQGLLSSSPPKSSGINLSELPTLSKRGTSNKASRRKKAFNPFRQQDEDAVLAKRSHNRRRWSHVFPATEVEFKRHAGPNWKSLSAPAILPISVDYFPPQTKIDLNFTISQYSINISDFEHHNFSSTKLLLLEMVRQRITQDFQLVPRSNVNASNYRKEWLSRQAVFNERPNTIDNEAEGDPLRMFLSMGHRLQVLSYVPSADTVHVTQYTDKKSSGEGATYNYQYMGFSQETGTFVKNVQSFQMYSSPYNWNKLDRILSGDSDRELREGMRVKSKMFVLIPDAVAGPDDEQKYVAKFQRLLDYFGKLRPKEEAETPLNVRIVTSAGKSPNQVNEDAFDSTPGIEGKSMVRFYVPLRKGRVDRSIDQFEYTEISLDATFNTSWTYRIMVNWLSASTTKIEQQVQSLQRRCTQYGLSVFMAPHLSVSRNVFLNPFRAPTLLSLRSRFKVPLLYAALVDKGYVYDGAFATHAASIAECMPGGSDFKFRRYGKLPHGRQFVHLTGALFVRVVVDKQGWALIVALANYRLISRVQDSVQSQCSAKVAELKALVESLE